MKLMITKNGGYDGMRHLTFPIIMESQTAHFVNGLVKITVAEMEKVGYDFEAGHLPGDRPDTTGRDGWLAFVIGLEAEVIGE